jgi:hypothetical protein
VGRLRRTFAAAQAFVAAGGDLGHLGSAAGRGP